MILTDQDNAMQNAIRTLFPRTIHRFCRWHMVKKCKDQLNQMYDQHPKLKDKLTSVINHPLNPEQFEAAWAQILDEFSLHDSSTMQKLYNDRHMWISAYFKEVFCGTMQSTQRSESMKSLVKGWYVDNTISINEFAKKILNCLIDMHNKEASEKYQSQV